MRPIQRRNLKSLGVGSKVWVASLSGRFFPIPASAWQELRATKKSGLCARSWLDWEQARSPRTKYMFNRGAAINYPFVCSRWDRRRCILINCPVLIWIKSHHAHISAQLYICICTRTCECMYNKIISINLIENHSVFIASTTSVYKIA